MPHEVIKIPHHITRGFIVAHPAWNFVYGYDLLHRGMLGQCWQTVGEVNTFPVYTCHKICSSSVYFQDNDSCMAQMLGSWSRIPKDKPVIIFRKIGQGCSRMNELAPKVFTEMTNRLNFIKYPNIEIINTTL